jgi:sulfur-oxidizing protein SoxB
MGLSRRELLQIWLALTALGAAGGSGLARAAGTQAIKEDDLLAFTPLGQVTLLHLTDLHAQLLPLYFREPSTAVGGSEVPYLTGRRFLEAFGIEPGTVDAYALSADDFVALARAYGRIGGLDRMAAVVKRIRAERPGRVLLLDGGDTWQGSLTSLKERGADMVRAMNALEVDAMTGHWEFTYGAARVEELRGQLSFPLLCANVKDATWNEPVFPGEALFERGGLRIAVIGQAYPYTPIANPRWLIPDWSFGIEEEALQQRIDRLRGQGVDLIVLLSHNGFAIDRKLAGRVKGIDVILSGHTHDALPQVIKVEETLLIASGSHGKFLGRLDLEVKSGRIADYRFRLIPLLSEVIAPDPDMARLIGDLRAPYKAELKRVLGRTQSLLYRRGTFNGPFDDLILEALAQERDAEIALSPGFRWGPTLLPEQEITLEDVYAQTAVTYAAAYRTAMSGAQLKTILEDVADNIFNPDPYYQQGGDMVRVGGLKYTVDVRQPIGRRLKDLRLLRNDRPIEAGRSYIVAGWASVNEGVQGPAVYDLVARYIERQQVIRVGENRNIKLVNAG